SPGKKATHDQTRHAPVRRITRSSPRCTPANDHSRRPPMISAGGQFSEAPPVGKIDPTACRQSLSITFSLSEAYIFVQLADREYVSSHTGSGIAKLMRRSRSRSIN